LSVLTLKESRPALAESLENPCRPYDQPDVSGLAVRIQLLITTQKDPAH
jgi:hypothetical protein